MVVSRSSVTWDNSKPSFIRRVVSIFKPRYSLRRKINDILYRLQVQRDRLNESINRLQKRDKELFEKTISAYVSRDFARAAIYASEVSELRKIVKVVYASMLALERVIVRLETVRDLGEVATVFAPLVPILKELRSQLSGIVPEIAIELDDISTTMNHMLMEIGQASTTAITVNLMDEGAKRVLEEAKAVAEEKLKQEFPQLPKDIPSTPSILESVIKTPTSPPSRVKKAPSKKISKKELESRILWYVKTHNGLLDISAFSRETGVSREDVLTALESLVEKGLIRTAT